MWKVLVVSNDGMGSQAKIQDQTKQQDKVNQRQRRGRTAICRLSACFRGLDRCEGSSLRGTAIDSDPKKGIGTATQ